MHYESCSSLQARTDSETKNFWKWKKHCTWYQVISLHLFLHLHFDNPLYFKLNKKYNVSISWNIGCSYYLSSAINPFLYSLLSKRFRNGFRDLKNSCFKSFQKIFGRGMTSRILSSRRTINTARINKSSFLEGFSMTPITIENPVSNPEVIVSLEYNFKSKNSALVSSQCSSSAVLSSKNEKSKTTNLEKEMFLLALQINSKNNQGKMINRLRNQRFSRIKRQANLRMLQCHC